jgi:hypothetical protein
MRKNQEHNSSKSGAISADKSKIQTEFMKSQSATQQVLNAVSSACTLEKFSEFYTKHAPNYPGAPKSMKDLPTDSIPSYVLELMSAYFQNTIDGQGEHPEQMKVAKIGQMCAAIVLYNMLNAQGHNSYSSAYASASNASSGARFKAIKGRRRAPSKAVLEGLNNSVKSEAE